MDKRKWERNKQQIDLLSSHCQGKVILLPSIQPQHRNFRVVRDGDTGGGGGGGAPHNGMQHGRYIAGQKKNPNRQEEVLQQALTCMIRDPMPCMVTIRVW